MIAMLRNTVAGIAAAFILFGTEASAVTFNFAFDDDAGFGDTVNPPIVGSGTISFDDPGHGTFDFFSLLSIDINLAIDGVTFTETDILTTTGTTAIITQVAAERFLQFGGIGDGLFGGSLDFQSGADFLTFSPGFLPGLYQFGPLETTTRFGDYIGTTAVIPVPATLPFLLAAIGGLGLLARRRSIAKVA